MADRIRNEATADEGYGAAVVATIGVRTTFLPPEEAHPLGRLENFSEL